MTIQRQSLEQWLCELTEFLPEPFIAYHIEELTQLYADKTSTRLAGCYARSYLLAPKLEVEAYRGA